MNELEQLKELIKKEIRLGETCDTEWDDGWDNALKMVLRWIERNDNEGQYPRRDEITGEYL